MTKIILPASLNPIIRRKDRSVKLSYETRELTPEETLTLMSLEGSEGWLMYAPNKAEIDTGDVPTENVSLDTKSPSERLRTRIFVHYKQATEDGSYIGLFENFYKVQMEAIISGYTKKNIKEI